MNTQLDIAVKEILPVASTILVQQGVPREAALPGPMLDTAEDAAKELASLLVPTGVLAEVTREEFSGIYHGLGFNASETPLEMIFPRADRLALFLVTCGQLVGDRIRDLFNANDFALAAALDAGASLAADQAAQAAQDFFIATVALGAGVLRYSPGYCGWHVSGQKALFSFLNAGSLPVTLTDSFLMHPLKSVSGVIVAGRPDIHRFAMDYPFCASCTGLECRDRIRSLSGPVEKET